MSRKTIKVAVAFGIVVAAVGYLVLTGLQGTMVYFVTVDELRAQRSEAYSKNFRVEGKVMPGSLKSSETELDFTFVIEDSGSTLQVKYNGILPDTFKEGLPVLVEGRYLPDGSFVAQQVYTKCPSKYESADEEQTSYGEKENPS